MSPADALEAPALRRALAAARAPRCAACDATPAPCPAGGDEALCPRCWAAVYRPRPAPPR